MGNPPQRNRLRYSLRSLLAVVTVSAIGSAALANPTELWASVVFSGTLVVLFFATLAAFSRRVAIGFAVFGWGYLALILWPGAEVSIAPNLVTTKAIAGLDAWWHRPEPDAIQMLPGGGSIARMATWSTGPFQRIGHSLFALLFAIAGSVVARWLWAGEDDA